MFKFSFDGEANKSEPTRSSLTFVAQRESAHLGEFLESLETDGASAYFKAYDGDLVLFDEAWSRLTLLTLLVNEADQVLWTDEIRVYVTRFIMDMITNDTLIRECTEHKIYNGYDHE